MVLKFWKCLVWDYSKSHRRVTRSLVMIVLWVSLDVCEHIVFIYSDARYRRPLSLALFSAFQREWPPVTTTCGSEFHALDLWHPEAAAKADHMVISPSKDTFRRNVHHIRRGRCCGFGDLAKVCTQYTSAHEPKFIFSFIILIVGFGLLNELLMNIGFGIQCK